MNKADYQSVLDRGAIDRGGKRWAWTIPIILPVTDDEAGRCTAGAQVALLADGKVFGVLTVADCYDWDKNEFISKVYGTDRMDHPGARLWTVDERTKLVGGTITLAAETANVASAAERGPRLVLGLHRDAR